MVKEKVTQQQPILNIFVIVINVSWKEARTFVCTDTTGQVLFLIHILGNIKHIFFVSVIFQLHLAE